MITTSVRLVALLSAVIPATAFAQNSDERPSSAGPQTSQSSFDDPTAIVVTARRREEALQDVPLPVTVLGGATLTDTSSYNVARVAQLLPTIQYYASNPRNSAINIRGLGAPLGLTNDGIEQGVGLYIDQVYYSRPASASFDFIDIDQIEVLRGPQGTLYGKNTTAGAINITTRAPSFAPEGQFEVSGGNLEFIQGKASISGPLAGDVLAGRFAVTGTSRRGTVYNIRTNSYVNEQNNIGFKGSLLYKGFGDIDLTLSADYNRQNPLGFTQVVARVFPTLRAANRQFDALATALNYTLPTRGGFERVTDVDSALQAKNELGGVSLLAEWDAGGGNSVTSVTAWRFWDWRPANDRDFIGLPITTLSQNNSNQRQLTQEFRFATSGNNRLDFVAGVFGYRQTINTNGLQEQGAAANLFTNGPTAGANAAVLNGLRQTNTIKFENNSLAAFGQATWNVTDALRIQPGIRFNYDTKDATYDAVVTGGIANPTPAQLAQQRAALPAQSYAADYKDFNISGDINVSWKPVEDVLLYGVYSRSFKSGGVNLNGLPFRADGTTVAIELAEVDPEKLDNFELGIKTQFWDRRVTLNVAGFYTDVKDYQITVSNGAIGVVRGYLSNADVRIKGVEAELSVRSIDAFSAYLNIAYTDAKFTDFPDAPVPPECTGITATTANVPANCVAIGTRSNGTTGNTVLDGFKDISGERFPGVSKWALAWGGQVDLPVSANGGEAYFGVDASYRSRFSSNATPSPFFEVAGYTLVNFRLGWRNDDKWNIFGWIKNAFDEDYYEFLSNQPGNNGLAVGQIGDQQTFGITVGKRF